jgi:predicted outer membrane repeat protein
MYSPRRRIAHRAGGIFCLLLMASSVRGGILYVDADAPGANTGANWTDAYRHLQDALAHVGCPCQPVEIRVAQGEYRSDQGAGQVAGNRHAAFQLHSQIILKGGYAGYGKTDPNARDIEAYETILSGDLLENDNEFDPEDWELIRSWVEDNSRYDNSYTVVNGSGTDATAVLDGFTITAGHSSIYDCYYGPECDQPYVQTDITPANNGGGIYINQGCPTVMDCTMYRNTTLSFRSGTGGAGMFNYQSHPVVRGCRFVENVVFSGDVSCRGAGMLNIDSAPHVSDCTFQGNIATGFDDEYYGGGMCNLNSNPSLMHCSFIDNISLYASGTGGGAIYSSDNSQPVLTGCYFDSNSARNGGAIMAVNIELNHCIFQDNQAQDEGGALKGIGVLRLAGCMFMGNSAERYGGALYVGYNADVEMQQSDFVENQAQRGGAIYNNGNQLKAVQCCFRLNQAQYAGAINSDGDINLTQCLLADNSAMVWGGALANMENTSKSLNCTYVNNSAQTGGAIFSNIECDTIVINSILWNNSATTGSQIATSGSHGGSTLTVDHCDIQGGQAGLHVPEGCTLNWLEGNLNVDPLFANSGAGDFHLKSQAGRWNPASESWVTDTVTSPCIDAGDPATPVGWEPFPNGGVVNMGAYGGTNEASKSYFGKPNCETPIAGDINGDCVVNFLDFAIMSAHWLEDHNLP